MSPQNQEMSISVYHQLLKACRTVGLREENIRSMRLNYVHLLLFPDHF